MSLECGLASGSSTRIQVEDSPANGLWRQVWPVTIEASRSIHALQ